MRLITSYNYSNYSNYSIHGVYKSIYNSGAHIVTVLTIFVASVLNRAFLRRELPPGMLNLGEAREASPWRLLNF